MLCNKIYPDTIPAVVISIESPINMISVTKGKLPAKEVKDNRGIHAI